MKPAEPTNDNSPTASSAECGATKPPENNPNQPPLDKGASDTSFELNSDGSQQIIDTADANCQVTVSADWAALARWALTETRLGYLINDNEVELDGSFMVLAYADGCVSWPKTPQDQQWGHRFFETMETYRRYRLDPAYLELMDELEEANSHTGDTASQ